MGARPLSHGRVGSVLRSLRTRYLVPALVFVLVVVSIGLVVLSPFALDTFGMSEEWRRRSEIGQTYGAAAALVSVLALVGISASLVLQAREAKIAREYTSRAVHSELMRMAMEDPVYRECWGRFGTDPDDVALRQHMYVNLIVSYWQSRYELGMFSDAHLRVGASDMFSAVPGRRFWLAARDARFAVSHTRRLRRFHRILDEEYQKAVVAGPPAPPPAPPAPPPAARPEGFRRRLAALLQRLASRIDSSTGS
jgi:hypothetical protein